MGRKPPAADLRLRRAPLADCRRVLGVRLPRLKVGQAKASRQGRSRAGLGRGRRLPPRDRARDGHALGRQLGEVGEDIHLVVGAPLTQGAVRENCTADLARAHGVSAQQTHAHAVIRIKAT